MIVLATSVLYRIAGQESSIKRTLARMKGIVHLSKLWPHSQLKGHSANSHGNTITQTATVKLLVIALNE